MNSKIFIGGWFAFFRDIIWVYNIGLSHAETTTPDMTVINHSIVHGGHTLVYR